MVIEKISKYYFSPILKAHPLSISYRLFFSNPSHLSIRSLLLLSWDTSSFIWLISFHQRILLWTKTKNILREWNEKNYDCFFLFAFLSCFISSLLDQNQVLSFREIKCDQYGSEFNLIQPIPVSLYMYLYNLICHLS